MYTLYTYKLKHVYVCQSEIAGSKKRYGKCREGMFFSGSRLLFTVYRKMYSEYFSEFSFKFFILHYDVLFVPSDARS